MSICVCVWVWVWAWVRARVCVQARVRVRVNLVIHVPLLNVPPTLSVSTAVESAARWVLSTGAYGRVLRTVRVTFIVLILSNGEERVQ